ncbi:MAG: flagellar hook assembly protein FlgD [Zoogloeaceae bacterium]|jgi:flagellar basal-body rod modification protein FlgD|nr:flagellar hook assembly protein FlgD [Zoogloeaceae bacterium]
MAIDYEAVNARNASLYSADTTSKVASASASAAAEMGDRFMTLFLTQLQNQDPLNPMDNSGMTTQLAQLNMVSSLETLNTGMTNLIDSYNKSMSLQAANLIGNNVLVPGKQMTLMTDDDNNNLGGIFGVELPSDADKVTVNIYDENGKLVSTQELGQQKAGAVAYYWDGKDTDGGDLPAGNYTFSVAATLDGEPVLGTALQAGTVSALVRQPDGSFKIQVAGVSSQIDLNDIRQVF